MAILARDKKKALAKLEQNYRNIKVIYNSDLNYSMYDKKLTTIYLENITKLEAQSASERDEVLLNGVKKKPGRFLEKQSGGNAYFIS